MTTATQIESGNMLTVEEALRRVEATENMQERQFVMSHGRAKFVQPDEEDPEHIQLSLTGERFNLYDEAYAAACKMVGISKGYAEKTPVSLMLPHLNFWFDNLNSEWKALIHNGQVISFIRPGTEIYSTAQIISRVVDTLRDRGAENIRIDKFYHDINETQFAVVSDLPAGEIAGRTLYKGVQVQNSVLGLKPLVISGYLHQDIGGIDAGMISANIQGQWDRRLGTSPSALAQMLEDGDINEDDTVYTVYEWIAAATGESIRRLDRDFENVEQLSQIAVGSHAGTLFNDLFTRYKIPSVLRKEIQEEYTDLAGNSLQELFTAVTAVSGRPEREGNPSATRHIMSVAGEIAAHPNSCEGCHRLLDA